MIDFDMDFPWVDQRPAMKALLKGDNTHFLVTEELGFLPSGTGEHLYLQVESNGDNTQWTADKIAEYLQVKPVDVGFCGLKDRHAITQQWFSVYDPKLLAEAHIPVLQAALPSLRLLSHTRAAAKLRRGDHAGNHFVITLLLDEQVSESAKAYLTERLTRIQKEGVPNYFGLQRFGRGGNNLRAFAEWLQAESELPINKRNKRRKPTGIILSAARSWLFNHVLAARVQLNNWHQVITGDVSWLDDGTIATGPLWGRGRSQTFELAAHIEREALKSLMPWANALEHLGLQQERRALVCKPVDFNWRIAAQQLTLSFYLTPGSYATSVLREICDCYEPDRRLETEIKNSL